MFKKLIQRVFRKGKETAEGTGSETTALVKRALQIIDERVVPGPVLEVKGAGSDGRVLDAVKLLEQAHGLEPANGRLHYAYAASLILAAQFKTAEEELEKLAAAQPDHVLARFSLEAWKAGGMPSPGVFRYPEWSPATSKLPRFYADAVKTFVLFPAREGIHPRAVLFEKDDSGWWTREKLRSVKMEVAVVAAPGDFNVVGLYRKCTGPGLKKPDMQEAVAVLDAPKDDFSVVGWEYLCDQNFMDIVVIGAKDSIVINQRIPLSEKTKSSLKKVRDILVKNPGRVVGREDMMRAIRAYQNRSSMDAIEKTCF